MRASLRASHTARKPARWLGSVARGAAALSFVGACLLGGCAHPKGARPAPVRRPPPRVLVVALAEVALRTTAWVEVHAWLASAARAHTETGDPELDAAARGYASALADDDRDELLGRTTHALERCEDERCARAAVTGTPLAPAYLAALPGFLERHWTDRAAAARDAMEVARAAMPPETEALVTALARDLAIDWPLSPPPPVDVVAAAPEPGRDAPIRALLGAHGGCFVKERKESAHVHDARIVDCVLAYAALRLDDRSELAVAIDRELVAKGKGSERERAWTAVVVHAVAVTVASWEPRHASSLRRSTAVVMPETMEWLAHEWPARLRGEAVPSFARRYVEALLESDRR